MDTASDTPEQEQVKETSFYCPGCGLGHKIEHFLCRGKAEAPHPPIEVVSTDELDGDPEDHTPAPPSA